MEDYIVITKDRLREWCEKYLDTHEDWTGTRVETVNNMESVEEFVDSLYGYLEEKYNW